MNNEAASVHKEGTRNTDRKAEDQSSKRRTVQLE